MELQTEQSRTTYWPSVGPASGRDETWVSLAELEEGAIHGCAMVGRSAAMLAVFSAIERLGPYRTTVLVQGDSGTGKELVARALHNFGPNPKGPYITFNCSNLVD